MVERYSRPTRERRARRTKRPIPEGRRARWSAVLAGTLVALVTYGLIATAIVESADGDDALAGWLVTGAAALLPVLMLILAFLTHVDRPWRTAGLAAFTAAVAFVATSFVAREVATGFVVAIGVGASFAMRLDEPASRRWRLWTIGGLAVYVKLLYVISPGVAIVAAPLLPVAGIAVVDSIAERRAAD